MTTLIAVYHNGLIITNEIGSYEFVEMNETFLLNGFLTLQNLVGLVRERLSWMNEGFEVRFKCQIDIWLCNGPRIKTMSPVYNEKEWTIHVGIMMKSKSLWWRMWFMQHHHQWASTFLVWGRAQVQDMRTFRSSGLTQRQLYSRSLTMLPTQAQTPFSASVVAGIGLLFDVWKKFKCIETRLTTSYLLWCIRLIRLIFCVILLWTIWVCIKIVWVVDVWCMAICQN
jgi:hypothetical protein